MDAEKPEGWHDNEPEEIDDPDSEMPEDWDEEEDGEWNAPKIPNPLCDDPGCGEWKRPMIANPKYVGKWSPPMIDNPAYKGVWAPKKIPNPDFFEDKDPLKNIGLVKAIALEVWSMNDGVVFDNILVAKTEEEAITYATSTWKVKSEKAVEQEEESEAEPMDFLPKLLELEFLQPIAPHVKPILDEAIAQYGANPVHLAFILLTTLPLLLFLFCCCCRSSASTVDEVAVAKKEDVTGEDDKPEETTEQQEEEEVKKSSSRRVA